MHSEFREITLKFIQHKKHDVPLLSKSVLSEVRSDHQIPHQTWGQRFVLDIINFAEHFKVFLKPFTVVFF